MASESLALKAREQQLTPPGISVLLGGTPHEAAEQMRQAFPDPVKYDRIHSLACVVGSTTVAMIRQAGFDVMYNSSDRFPNHARIIHPDGAKGFSGNNLTLLASMFTTTATESIAP